MRRALCDHRPLGAAQELEAKTAATTTLDGGIPPFERIVAEHGPLISRIAMSYEADPALREDLVQQIFLAVWQALPSYRADASLKTFIARIAQNRAISFVTRQVRQPPLAEMLELVETAAPSPEQSAIAASERRMLIEATRRLPVPQRQVIVLILEGFTYAEIGEMLNIAPNALALRLSRAKAALKKMLERRP
ncbi:MAG: sigma-70 family RNA polymerase sigma factor [Pseudomonadota bacterium]|nr:sigma-70 family RNA polymerase sigma factor [Pseudomonadota bacterium]